MRSVMVRTSRGGSRLLRIDAPVGSTIADVKLQLCRPPYSLCSHASALALVSAGSGANGFCAHSAQL
jgi:hypothetical protein